MKHVHCPNLLVLGIIAIFTMVSVGDTYAHHRPGHNPPGHSKKEKGHKKSHKVKRGSPPAWAPAWGRRGKTEFTYSQDNIERTVTTDILVKIPSTGTGICYSEVIGAVLGSTVGGVVGSKIGSGSGKTLATIGGAIIGALVGGKIGRTMDDIDQNCVGQILERTPTGRNVVWRNPNRANDRYEVTPTPTYRTRSGTHCRNYQTKVTISSRIEIATGTAYRQTDGKWKKV